ncbi:AbfB domain-containing protein [Stigmatella sp. ncwal1]|uniref:AbfB domain-containing protein n=1 Tax=Stigmatella ashevillensis TaxID=2995309 RepID=A0ABT5DEW7_9BACT|nr:AbfB domain-containing protein [Stigmatella ashevillena]MDC0712210.1 AbfB domain-containing protein [Stigmatella ashevillena]
MRDAKLLLTTLLASVAMTRCEGASDTAHGATGDTRTVSTQIQGAESPSAPGKTALSWVPLRLNVYHTFGVTTPNYTNRVLRHYESLARTDVIGTSPVEKADSSFRVVTGLADSGCYSLQSQNYPDKYLRHASSRIRIDSRDGTRAFDEAATWCTRPGLSGQGVSLESYNFPGRYMRHANSEVWLAQRGGSLPSDAEYSFNDDASWKAISQVNSDFKAWGEETLAKIEQDFRRPGSNLYYEGADRQSTAFIWGAGVQLHALIAGGKTQQAEAFANELHQAYWCNTKGRWGYDAVAYSCGDRYYDDNAWVAKALMELHQKTNNATYLNRAKEVLAFSMSGENSAGSNPNGGIRWHEGDTGGQCLCATAPTAVANLMVYRATGTQQYLNDGLRLYKWVKANRFGYGPGYRGYENGVMTQAAILLFKITGNYTYLDDARHLALAMESTYIDWQTHALKETGQWGGNDMTNAYVDLYETDGDINWLNIVAGYLQFLRDNGKDANGRYPEVWSDVGKPGNPFLLYQASAARAFARMGNTRGGTAKPRDPVAVFQDCNYAGIWGAGFLLGRYTLADLQFHGITGKDISSVRVQPGYKVTFYENDNFGGASLVKTADDGCLVGAGWNDRVSSMVVEAVSPTVVVYKDCNFTHPGFHLPVGSYDEDTLRTLGLSPDVLSSIQAAEGYEAVLYDGGRFDQASFTTGTTSCLVGAGWNDKAASIVIRKKASP